MSPFNVFLGQELYLRDLRSPYNGCFPVNVTKVTKEHFYTSFGNKKLKFSIRTWVQTNVPAPRYQIFFSRAAYNAQVDTYRILLKLSRAFSEAKNHAHLSYTTLVEIESLLGDFK